MVIYYSGTGNSRYCAQMLAKGLKDEKVDALPYLQAGSGAVLHSTKAWVFVCPTYAWQPPKIFADFLCRCQLSGSRDAYFLLTCGTDTGNADKSVQQICKRLQLRHRGTFPIVMPGKLYCAFSRTGPEQAAQIRQAALPRLEAALACIQKEADFPKRKCSLWTG